MFKNSKAFSSFSVNDLRKAKDFYQNVLGLEVMENEKMEMLELPIGEGCSVMVYPKQNHQPATFTVLNFSVDNIDAAVEKLTSKGIKPEQYTGEIKTDEKGIFREEGIQVAWFKDPAGNILSVVQEEKEPVIKMAKEKQKVSR